MAIKEFTNELVEQFKTIDPPTDTLLVFLDHYLCVKGEQSPEGWKEEDVKYFKEESVPKVCRSILACRSYTKSQKDIPNQILQAVLSAEVARLDSASISTLRLVASILDPSEYFYSCCIPEREENITEPPAWMATIEAGAHLDAYCVRDQMWKCALVVHVTPSAMRIRFPQRSVLFDETLPKISPRLAEPLSVIGPLMEKEKEWRYGLKVGDSIDVGSCVGSDWETVVISKIDDAETTGTALKKQVFIDESATRIAEWLNVDNPRVQLAGFRVPGSPADVQDELDPVTEDGAPTVAAMARPRRWRGDSAHYVENVNSFADENGFETLFEILATFSKEETEVDPVFVCEIVRIFGLTCMVMHRALAESLLKKAVHTVIDSLLSASVNVLRKMHRSVIGRISEHLLKLVQRLKMGKEEAGTLLEIDFGLGFCKKCLLCGVLEQQLNAVSLLTDALKSTFPHYSQPAYFLTVPLFLKWMQENDVFEMLLGLNSHVGMFKACSDLLRILGQQKSLPYDILKLVWQSAVCSSAERSAAAVKILDDLSFVLTEEQLEAVTDWLMNLEPSKLCDRVFEVSKNLLRCCSTKPKIASALFSFLWSFVCDAPLTMEGDPVEKAVERSSVGEEKSVCSTPPPEDERFVPFQAALDALQSEMDGSIYRLTEHKLVFIRTLASCVSSGHTVPAAVQLLITALGAVPVTSNTEAVPARDLVIGTLLKEPICLVEATMREMLVHPSDREDNFPSKSTKSEIERQTLLQRLLQYLLLHSTGSVLSTEHITHIWDCLIIKCAPEREEIREATFNWLLSVCNKGKIVISEEASVCLFELLKKSVHGVTAEATEPGVYVPLSLSMALFRCFIGLFKSVNIGAERLEQTTTGLVLMTSSLDGLLALWRLIVFSTHPEVAEKAREFMISLSRGCRSLPEAECVAFRSFLVDMAVDALSAALESLKRDGVNERGLGAVSRLLCFLKSFLYTSGTNGLHGYRSHANRLRGSEFELVVANAIPKGASVSVTIEREDQRAGIEELKFPVCANDTLFDVIKQVSRMCQIPLSSLSFMKQSGDRFVPEDNAKSLRDLGITETNCRIRLERNPREVIQKARLAEDGKATPLFEAAAKEVFSRYCNKDCHFGPIELQQYFRSCGATESSLDEKRMLEIFRDYDSVTVDGEQFMTELGFIEFYIEATRSRANYVYSDFRCHEYRDDLQLESTVCQEQLRIVEGADPAVLPHVLLSRSPRFSALLFEFIVLCESPSPLFQQVREDCLFLLSSIPSDDSVVRSFKSASSTEWAKLLPAAPVSRCKLMYGLEIVEGLLDHDADGFVGGFIASQGLTELLNLLSGFPIVEAGDVLDANVLALLMKLVGVLLSALVNLQSDAAAKAVILLSRSCAGVSPHSFSTLSMEDMKYLSSVDLNALISGILAQLSSLISTATFECGSSAWLAVSAAVKSGLWDISLALVSAPALFDGCQGALLSLLCECMASKVKKVRKFSQEGTVMLCNAFSVVGQSESVLWLFHQFIDVTLGKVPNVAGVSPEYFDCVDQLLKGAFLQFGELTEELTPLFHFLWGAVVSPPDTHANLLEANKRVGNLILICTLCANSAKFKSVLVDRIRGHQKWFLSALFPAAAPSEDEEEPEGGPLSIPPRPRRLLSAAERVQWYGLLTIAIDDVIAGGLLSLIDSIHCRVDEPSGTRFSPTAVQKSPLGYVGLRNLGCTCYLNSVLQQLFMCPPLRDAILSSPVLSIDNGEEGAKEDLRKNSSLYQLQVLFAHLQHSESRDYDTKPFCNALKDDQGNPVNPVIQQDAQEFFGLLCDRLEVALKGTDAEKLIEKTFTGSVVNQLMCKGGCGTCKERVETFYFISIQVQHLSCLEDGLRAFITGESISDFHCDTCNRSVDVEKRVLLGNLPSTLVVHLKRFEFNLQTFLRQKINNRFSFPDEVDLFPYTRDAAAGAIDDDHSAFKYRLAGVVLHSGTCESGHYRSLVRKRSPQGLESQWIEFNDSLVRQYSSDDFESTCFGKETANQSSRGQMMMGMMMGMMDGGPSESAYLLVYERVVEGIVDTPCSPPSQSVMSIVEAANSEQRVLKDVFSPKHLSFVAKLATSLEALADEQQLPMAAVAQLTEIFLAEKDVPIAAALEACPELTGFRPAFLHMLCAVRFLLRHHARAGDKDNAEIEEVCDRLSRACSVSVPLCQVLLGVLIRKPEYFRELVVGCSTGVVREGLCKMVKVALTKLIPLEQDSYRVVVEQLLTSTNDVSDERHSLVVEFIATLLDKSKVLRSASPGSPGFEDFWGVLAMFADVGMLERRVLLLFKILSQAVPSVVQELQYSSQYARSELHSFLSVIASITTSSAIGPLPLYRTEDTWDGCVADAHTIPPHLCHPNASIPVPMMGGAVSTLSGARVPLNNGAFTLRHGWPSWSAPSAQTGPDGSWLLLRKNESSCLLSAAFYMNMVTQKQNMRAVTQLLCHLSWNWEEFSVDAMGTILKVLHSCSRNDVVCFVGILQKLIALPDNLRGERTVVLLLEGTNTKSCEGLLGLIGRTQKTRRFKCLYFVKALCQLVRTVPLVASTLADCRPAWNWLDSFCESQKATGEKIWVDIVDEYEEMLLILRSKYGMPAAELEREVFAAYYNLGEMAGGESQYLAQGALYEQTSQGVTVQVQKAQFGGRSVMISNSRSERIEIVLEVSGQNVFADRPAAPLVAFVGPNTEKRVLTSLTRVNLNKGFDYRLQWRFREKPSAMSKANAQRNKFERQILEMMVLGNF